MLIKINNVDIQPFNMFTTGFSVSVESSTFSGDGEVRLSQIYLESAYEVITSIELISDDYKKNVILQNPTVHYLDDQYTSLVFACQNIMNIHKKILELLNYDFIIHNSLRCYNLPLLCNLQCPYCGQRDNKKTLKSFDHYINSIIIDEEWCIGTDVSDQMKNVAYDRYMGGETFINWNEFDKTVEFYSGRHFTNKRMMEIYTNLTIKDSIKKMYNFILTNKYYKMYDLWFSIDSIDIQKSQRIKNEISMQNLKDNLDDLRLLLLPLINVTINFNIMYIDYDTTVNIAKYLSSLGFKYFKLATDDTRIDREYAKFKSDVVSKCFFECKKYLLVASKMDHRNDFVYYFNVTEFGNPVYTNKYAFRTNRNYIEIYKPYLLGEVDHV